MNNMFWIGCQPALTQEMLDYVLDVFDGFFKGFDGIIDVPGIKGKNAFIVSFNCGFPSLFLGQFRIFIGFLFVAQFFMNSRQETVCLGILFFKGDNFQKRLNSLFIFPQLIINHCDEIVGLENIIIKGDGFF